MCFIVVEILESRTLRTSKLSEPPLLKNCREFSEGSSEPIPVWIRDDADESRPIWMPDGWSDQDTVQALAIHDRSRPDWSLTLYFWNRYGGPNPVEKGRILRECSPEETERSRLLDQLDLPNAREVLDAYRKFPELPETLREQVATGEVSSRLFRYFYRIPEPLQPALLDLLSAYHRTFSVQDTRQLAEALRRLAPGEYDCFLEQIEYPQEDESARAVGQMILDEARKRAYPERNRRREKFEDDLESLNLDGRIQVEPPKNFEGNYLEFSFRCERDEDLSSLAEEVKKCQKLLKHV